MTNDDDDYKFFSRVRIESRFAAMTAEGDTEAWEAETELNPGNLGALAAQSVSSYPAELQAQPFCIISRASTPEEQFNSAEHFIPEGLGYSWTKLPSGTATCDRINAKFSRYELEWLRFGPMGTFRPFFVEGGKNAAPEYHAPKKSSRQFSFTRDPTDGTRIITLISDAPLEIPKKAGPGEMTIRVQATEANSTYVSLALHKMAYLALWLAHPGMVLDAGFQPLLDFLNSPTKKTYRPFRERMIPGSSPGVEFKFYVRLNEVTGETQIPSKRVFGVNEAHVALRVHHMLYFLTLLGSMPEGESWNGAELKEWQAPGEVPRSITEISFGVGGVEPQE